MRILVVYYSLEGNTGKIASSIAEALGADIQELRPVKDIKPGSVGKYLWGGRQVMARKQPVLERLERNPREYDMIFLGSPVWAYTFAPALRSFFVDFPLKGKQVAVFLCHGGGPREAMKRTVKMLAGNTTLGTLELENVLAEGTEQKVNMAVEWASDLVRKAGLNNHGA